MTPDTRRIAVWGGCGAVVVLAGWGWTALRSSDSAEAASKADQLHGEYVKLYHPDSPRGLSVDAAQTELRRTVAAQEAELHSASGPLAPPLSADYLVESVSEAADKVKADYAAVRQPAASARIGMPTSLPYESGLDVDKQERSRQLANLSLIRQAVLACIHAGMRKISNVQPGLPTASPDGQYAVFRCDLDIDGDWGATARLLAAFAQADGRGLGLQRFEVVANADGSLRSTCTATLTTLNQDIWALSAAPLPGPSPSGVSRLRTRDRTRP